MRRTVSGSIGCVDTGVTTPLTLMLIGAPHEMKMSEACFSAISLNRRSRYMVGLSRRSRAATMPGWSKALYAPGAPAKRHDDVMNPREGPTGRRTAVRGHPGAGPTRD